MSYVDAANDYGTYAALRQVLNPDLAVAPAAVIRQAMEAEFGEGAAEAYNDQIESLWGDIGKFAKKAAPAIATVGGGVLKGAMAGSSLGLPGIIAGAATGGVGAGLSRYGGRGTAGKIGAALTGVTNLAGQFSPMGRMGASLGPAISGLAGGRGGAGGMAAGLLNGVLGATTGGAGGAGGAIASLLGGGRGGAGGGIGQALGGLLKSPGAAQALSGLFGGSSAAGQLASLLQRPETQQAFAALQLGKLGRPTVPVGTARIPVPTAAFPEAVAHLADQISAEAASWSGEAEAALGYMQDAEGEYVGDPSFGRDRAARVWELLNEAQAERVLGALAAPPAPMRRFSEGEAESWSDWEAEMNADAEWHDTLEMLEAESGDSEWSDAESEYAQEGEYADA